MMDRFACRQVAVRREAGHVGADARLGAAGSVLGVAGGVLVAAGALLPWERYVSTSSPAPGCFGCGSYSVEFSGWQVGNGAFAFFAGLAIAVAALLTSVHRPVRRWSPALLAVALAVAVAAVGGWWLQRPPAAVAAVGMEMAGIILGLAALPLCLPGSARRRSSVLAATVLLSAVGVAVAWPMSAAITIQS
ncbi:MAG TPA: hypothetical protein VH089_07745 [Streptosporangiaceae bacterium]|nr:hypothetical protein [Streptosporangiaceae bacterium]